jgi:hypothetical protein
MIDEIGYIPIDRIYFWRRNDTNNRERLTGSCAYITELARVDGYGLVTSHDLELADLDKSISNLINAHFQETVSAGALQFDYTLPLAPARQPTHCGSWNWKDCRSRTKRDEGATRS